MELTFRDLENLQNSLCRPVEYETGHEAQYHGEDRRGAPGDIKPGFAGAFRRALAHVHHHHHPQIVIGGDERGHHADHGQPVVPAGDDRGEQVKLADKSERRRD